MSFILEKAEEAVFFRSSLIDCPHAFSTRLGGVSALAHTASLNLAFGRGDEDAVVLENLRRFAMAAGVDPRSVVSRPQIHSSLVCRVDEKNRGEGYFVPAELSCDGYVTNTPGVTLGVKTADCVPILLYDPVRPAVGAVHAGWRGTAAGIAPTCVSELEGLGCEPKDIRAAVGAAIGFCCYEVGEDFFESVSSLVGAGTAQEFIRPRGEKLHADLPGLNRRLLLEAGLSEEHIDVSPHCTCHEPELFYSHRASKGLRGTMLSVIALPNVTAV